MDILHNLDVVQAALPLQCSRSNDAQVKARTERCVRQIIRSYALLVGDVWAIVMHDEASRCDFAAVVERSKDLAWLCREQRRTGQRPLWLDEHRLPERSRDSDSN